MEEEVGTLCPKCGLACGEAEYKVHVENNCQTIKCSKCPQFYDNEDALARHNRAIHDKEFQCSICHIEYATKYTLERHIAVTHKPIDNEKTKCEQCGKLFEGKYFLKTHILHAHRKGFMCSLCEQEFVTVYTLKRHTERVHSNGKINRREKTKVLRIECPKCGKSIAKPSLERHFRIKHNKERQTTCYVCDRECPSEKALQKHIDSRHPEEKSVEALIKKKFKCPQCPRRFSAKSVLITHIKGKHEEQFKCEFCDRLFSAQSSLDLHVKGKHEQQFKCEICEKFFSAPFSLTKHKINVHGLKVKHETVERYSKISEEDLLKKKHKCPQCPRRFAASWTLKTHIKAKHEKQFKCELCNKLFSAKFPLIRHKANVHGLRIEDETVQIESKTSEEQLTVKDEIEENEGMPPITQNAKKNKEPERNELSNS